MSCLCCLLKAQCCQLERRGKITEIKSELFSHITNILWVKCFKQKYIFTVSLPVMPFGFRFASKICEAVRVSQISSGLQGFWVHRHSCDPSNLSTVTLAGCFHQEEEITELETIPFFFFFSTLVCLQRPYTNSCFHQLKEQETVFICDVPGCCFSSRSCPRRTHWLSLFYISVGVRLQICPADYSQLSTSDCAMFLAAYYTYTYFHQNIYINFCVWSQLMQTPSAPMAQLLATLTYIPFFWTVATTCQFTVGWMKLFLTLLLIKKSIWACEKQYLITVNLITNLYYYLIILRLPCL